MIVGRRVDFGIANRTVQGVAQTTALSNLILAGDAGEALNASAPETSTDVCAVAAILTRTRSARIVDAVAQRWSRAGWAVALRHCSVVRADSAILAAHRHAWIQIALHATTGSQSIARKTSSADTHRCAVRILNTLGVCVADTAIITLVVGAYGACRACFSVAFKAQRAIAAPRWTLRWLFEFKMNHKKPILTLLLMHFTLGDKLQPPLLTSHSSRSMHEYPFPV